MKLQLTTERDERDEAGEPTGARAAAISGRNPSSGRPAAAWHSNARPGGRAGQQRPARAEEVQQDSRKGPRRCGGRRAGAGRRRFSAPWEEEARCGRSRTRAVRLSRSGQDRLREADVFWAPSTARGASTRTSSGSSIPLLRYPPTRNGQDEMRVAWRLVQIPATKLTWTPLYSWVYKVAAPRD